MALSESVRIPSPEKAQRIDRILSAVVERAKVSNLPVAIFQYGSTVFGDRICAKDLDVFLIADNNILRNYGILIGQRFGLEYQPASTPEQDLEDLITGKVNILKFKIMQDGIPIELNVSTTENLAQILLRNSPAIVRRKRSDSSSDKYLLDYPYITLDGNTTRVPLTMTEDNEQYFDVAYPGFYPSRENPQMLANPKIYDQFLTGGLIYDNSNSELASLIESRIWSIIVPLILSANNLLNRQGKPLQEAYDGKYIMQILIRNGRFTDKFKETIRQRYFRALDTMGNAEIDAVESLSSD